MIKYSVDWTLRTVGNKIVSVSTDIYEVENKYLQDNIVWCLLSVHTYAMQVRDKYFWPRM